MSETSGAGELDIPDDPHGFETNPHAPEVETTYVAYQCGGSIIAPAHEVDAAPSICPVCGEPREDE